MNLTSTTPPARIRGVWPPMLLYWDADERLDERTTDANLDRQLAARPDGIYTLDTASEFYTLELDEWRAIARRFVGRVRGSGVDLPIGLGCTWTNLAGALARVREARDLGVNVIHLSAPYWVPLNEEGLLVFFEHVQRHAGGLGVIVYAPPHGRITLDGRLYRKLIDVAPCIIGTKTAGTETDLLAEPAEGPRHSHAVGEQCLTPRHRDGATACYSALAGISIAFMKQWFAELNRGDWTAAEARQARVERFYQQAIVPIRQRGFLAGAIDKAMAQAGGAVGNRSLRAPYLPVPDDLYQAIPRAAREHLHVDL